MRDGLRGCIESRAQAQCKVQLLYVSCSKSYIIVSVFQSCNLSAEKQNCFQWTLGDVTRLAQLVERSPFMPVVVGSSPTGGGKGCRQMRSSHVSCCANRDEPTSLHIQPNTLRKHFFRIDICKSFSLIKKMHLSLSCDEDQYFLVIKKLHIILSHFTGVGTQAIEKPILYSKPPNVP